MRINTINPAVAVQSEQNPKTHRKHRFLLHRQMVVRAGRWCLVGLLSLILLSCATYDKVKHQTVRSTKKITRIRWGANKYPKKVAITPFRNVDEQLSPQIAEMARKQMREVLAKECSKAILIKPDDPNFPELLHQIPRKPSGMVDNLLLAQLSRPLGLNAIVTGNLVAIRREQKDKGWMWFRRTRHYVRAQIRTEVWDTETGAKVLDQGYGKPIKLDEIEYEEGRPLDANAEEKVAEAVLRATTGIAEHICDAIYELPWSSYVIGIENDQVLIASGETVGIKAGDVFNLFENEEIITGAAGQHFYKPGKNCGQIEVVNVYPEYAEAAIIKNDGIKVGNTVIPD